MIAFAKRGKAVPSLILSALFVSAIAAAQAQPKTTVPAKVETESFIEVTSKLGMSVPALAHAPEASDLRSIAAGDFSLEYARQHLIPAMGGSIAVGGVEGDGRRCLYVVVPGGSNHLLSQNEGRIYADITEKAKVSGTGGDLGAAFGDYDHSGRQSLFVAGLGGVRLYRNEGAGAFSDVTEKAGLKGKASELATSVLLFDADGDGFLDVLVTIYTDLSVPPTKPSFTFPNDFSGANSHLYRNQHDGTFREVTEAAGLDSNPGRTRRAVAADFEHNGRLDLLLLRDNKPPVLYLNQGEGKFDDRTWDAGKEIWRYAYLDAQTADFNHDGKVDLALWSTVGNEILWNVGEGKFEDDEAVLPLVYAANRPFGFHGTVLDSGDGYASLLTQDKNESLRLILNDHGHFSEAQVELREEKPATTKTADTARLPAFAWMGAARVAGAGTVELLVLTTDGRVMVFDKQDSAMKAKSSAEKSGK
jgi:hypothetical protein